ncbi:MAG TPA: hypothetical protein VHB73_01835, partial [Alphaproteobacteria bacterium]|nr:hypothetical protein [Alphaproteobacteria bacterium]
ETLEKANFLLRNLSTQTDRVKTGVQEVSGALLERLSEMLCTFEDELKGLTNNAGFGLEELQRKAESLGARLREEAQMASQQVEAMFAGLPQSVEQSLSAAAQQAENAVAQLRAQSQGTALAIQDDVRQALVGTGAQLLEVQNEFRQALSGTAEALVGHLRQVQEAGNAVMTVMQHGAAAGAEQAMQVLAGLRESAEKEVLAMRAAIEQSMAQMENISTRLRDSFAAGSDDVRIAAEQIFAKVREGAESELQSLLARAESSLQGLQEVCQGVTSDVRTTLSQAESASQNFSRVTEELREQSQRTANTVAEAERNFVNAGGVLQRSQGALSEVAQKSTQVLSAFNDNLSQQAKQVGLLHDSIQSMTQNMGQADERLAVLKQGFESVLNGLTERLNQGLYSLSKQILSVRGEAEGAAQAVNQSAQELASQNGGIAKTAGVLATALSQMEDVGRTLADSVQHSASQAAEAAQDIEARAERAAAVSEAATSALDDLATRMQNQLAYVEEAARVLDQPINQFDALNERLSTTLSLAAQAARMPATASVAPIAPRPPPPYVPPVAPRPPAPAPSVRPRSAASSEALREKMQRLAGSGSAARTAPAAKAPGAPRSDNELVQSLTQIIQQLEETAGVKPEDAAAQQRKAK